MSRFASLISIHKRLITLWNFLSPNIARLGSISIKHTKGVATEYNTTHQAVSETAGEILGYDEGGVVESLYGATQEIVNEAHKGLGISQTGAYAYAAQGNDYQQILAESYPRVAIARLESKRWQFFFSSSYSEKEDRS